MWSASAVAALLNDTRALLVDSGAAARDRRKWGAKDHDFATAWDRLARFVLARLEWMEAHACSLQREFQFGQLYQPLYGDRHCHCSAALFPRDKCGCLANCSVEITPLPTTLPVATPAPTAATPSPSPPPPTGCIAESTCSGHGVCHNYIGP